MTTPHSHPVAGQDWIPSADQRLFHQWRRPAPAAIHARVLILHGYGDHSGRFIHLMDWLAERGVATDAFDFRGHGKSSGKRGFVRRWPAFLDDLRAALLVVQATALSAGIADRPLFVLGHSHGGLVAAAAGIDGTLKVNEIAGVVLSAPYLQPAVALSPLWKIIAAVTDVVSPSLRVASGLSGDMLSSDPAMLETSRLDPLLLRSATPRWYAEAVRTQLRVTASAGRFILPLLCLIGDADKIASSAAARLFVDRSSSVDKTFVQLPGQKHEILRELNREQTFARILNWIERHEA